MNLEQIIAKQEKKLLDKYGDGVNNPALVLIEPTESGVSQRSALQEILDFHSSSIKEILEGVMPMYLDLLWENKELQEAITIYGEWNDTELQRVYEKAKSDTINYLESIIKKL